MNGNSQFLTGLIEVLDIFALCKWVLGGQGHQATISGVPDDSFSHTKVAW